MSGLLLAACASSTCSAASTPPSPHDRDPLQWPFCSESIWNEPIGSDAVFVDAKITPFHNVGPDVSHFVVASDVDPLVEWYKVEHWGGPRCEMPSSGVGCVPNDPCMHHDV